jgi:ectoine hydroxylase-related dioxygenase (phytanoyl-CoA dioxygenase family)
MSAMLAEEEVSAEQHADDMATYLREGERRAYSLGNRGPIKLDADGKLDKDILRAYLKYGFYVFENVIDADEIAELSADVDRVLAGAPVSPDAELDAQGRPAIGGEFTRETFRLARPLSDPVGGTDFNLGRHPVKMQEPIPGENAPAWTVQRLVGNLQTMDSCLRLYGHPGLLAVAEAVNGADFVPFNEVGFVKEPGLGVSVAWHRDGTTHWGAPDWNELAHGFNFMCQIFGSTPGNGVWVLPGTHKQADFDIKAAVAESGSERLEGAVPMVCNPGDVVISNRQVVHGSFANTSTQRRVTLNMGFYPRRRVAGLEVKRLDNVIETYDNERIHQRSRMIAVAIDARAQKHPDEPRYCYQPLKNEEAENRWSEATRKSVVHDYNVRDLFI